MTMKTYGQMCSIARSLDVLGERWSMLIVRELLLGPKRFKSLLAALSGVGSNRLSDRLKGLEEAGIVRRTTLPAPAAVPAYELTAQGERLRGPLVALGLWGLDLPLDERIDPQTLRAELIAMALAGTQTKLLDRARRDAVEFQVGDEVFHLQLRDGRFMARSGPSPSDPAVRVGCDLQTFVDLALRTLTPAQAIKDGRAAILAGSRNALTELYRVLVYDPEAPLLSPV
jgi:DNA-binding HxlR family transcriptional regulator